jgi:hypothetical protein
MDNPTNRCEEAISQAAEQLAGLLQALAKEANHEERRQLELEGKLIVLKIQLALRALRTAHTAPPARASHQPACHTAD